MGRLVSDDRKATVTQITTRYNQGMQNNISEHTTHRTLKQMGYSSRIPHRVLLLSAKNRKRRLQFTQAHQNWTIEDWKNVAWSDESRFLLRHSDGRVRIWHKEHERAWLLCTIPWTTVCTSLLFTLLFIKSQYTVFLFLYILLFFAHLIIIVFLFFFAHPFCTSYCLFAHRIVFLHIVLFFLHILLFCTFFISLHILLLFLLFLPHVCPCVMLLYITCILIILHCPLSGPGSITFHF